jgi:hypothetical protein
MAQSILYVNAAGLENRSVDCHERLFQLRPTYCQPTLVHGLILGKAVQYPQYSLLMQSYCG